VDAYLSQVKTQLLKAEEAVASVGEVSDFKGSSIKKIEYVEEKLDQTNKLLAWAKRTEQDTVCKTMGGKIQDEIKKVGEIV
jgi:hypothetical protein